MKVKKELMAPCGLYCGVCGIHIATSDNNTKFKERFASARNVTVDQINCDGCLSGNLYVFCKTCSIRSCALKKGIEGCHQCAEFPCKFIQDFPIEVGKKVMLRAIPDWKKLGTEKFVEGEEKRYTCPNCGYQLFRGARRCRQCQQPVDVD